VKQPGNKDDVTRDPMPANTYNPSNEEEAKLFEAFTCPISQELI